MMHSLLNLLHNNDKEHNEQKLNQTPLKHLIAQNYSNEDHMKEEFHKYHLNYLTLLLKDKTANNLILSQFENHINSISNSMQNSLCISKVISEFIDETLTIFQMNFYLLEESISWHCLKEELSDNQENINEFNPSSYYISPFSFPFSCPTLLQPNVYFKDLNINEVLLDQTTVFNQIIQKYQQIYQNTINQNNENKKINSLSQTNHNQHDNYNTQKHKTLLDLFLKLNSKYKNSDSSLISIYKVTLSRFDESINSLLFIYNDSFDILTFSSLSNAKDDLVLPTLKDSQSILQFINRVFHGYWGNSCSIFGCRVVIHVYFKDLIYISSPFNNSRTFTLWTIDNGSFQLTFKKTDVTPAVRFTIYDAILQIVSRGGDYIKIPASANVPSVLTFDNSISDLRALELLEIFLRETPEFCPVDMLKGFVESQIKKQPHHIIYILSLYFAYVLKTPEIQEEQTIFEFFSYFISLCPTMLECGEIPDFLRVVAYVMKNSEILSSIIETILQSEIDKIFNADLNTEETRNKNAYAIHCCYRFIMEFPSFIVPPEAQESHSRCALLRPILASYALRNALEAGGYVPSLPIKLSTLVKASLLL